MLAVTLQEFQARLGRSGRKAQLVLRPDAQMAAGGVIVGFVIAGAASVVLKDSCNVFGRFARKWGIGGSCWLSPCMISMHVLAGLGVRLL